MIDRSNDRSLGIAALILFALSGCSGLIYQSVWTQYLGLYLGHSAYAQSLVLAIFMGGMAVGAWWASRATHDWRNLLRAYAVIELVIGLAAAVFHPIFVGVTNFALDTALPALPIGWGSSLFKWSTGTLLILPQAVLLGMTFPLMSNALMRRHAGASGAVLSGLYFTNSIGAAFGALFATFALLPAIGLPGAMRVGAILNVLVALFAYLLSREDEAVPARAQQSGGRVPLERLLLAAAFITGASSFVYEIGWVRMLSMALGSTAHAFEMMLAAFIGGLAFGGLWIRRRIDGYAEPLRAGGVVQVLMGLAALLSLVLYDRSFDWVAWFLGALGRTDEAYVLYNLVSAVVSILIMAPAAFFAGMTLPLFTLALMRRGGGEASVGRIYAANTIGAIVGVFAAVHLLVPLLGLKYAMILAAVADLALGVVLLRPSLTSAPRGKPAYVTAIVVGVAGVVFASALAHFDPAAMAAGVYRTGRARYNDEGQKVLFYKDGKTASIGSMDFEDGTRNISTNGKPDAALQMDPAKPPSLDESTMVIAAVLPLALHPAPHEAAAIGFGSGLSTHALLGDKRIERVDTIEIEHAMYEGARVFLPLNERAYDDPRSHIYFEDAKTYFASHAKSYDIILSEPSNPWVSGVATLFSREFYRFVPRHLKQGGILVQWIQLYEINDALVGTIINALSESFADFRIYQTGTGDMLVLASHGAPLGEISEAPFKEPGLQPLLKRLKIESPADLEIRRIGDRRSLGPFFSALTSRANSDFYPLISLEAPRTRFRKLSAQYLGEIANVDLPVLEVVDGQAPKPPGATAETQHLARSRLIARAPLLVAALAGDPHDAQKLGTQVSSISVVREAFATCPKDVDSMVVIDNLGELAAYTIPHLPADDLRRAWIEPAWQRCDSPKPELRAFLDLLKVLAARDWPAVETAATAMLNDHRAHMSADAGDYVLRAGILALIAQGRYDKVAAFEAEFGKRSPPSDEHRFLRRVHLLSYADAEAKKGAAAQSAGKGAK